MNLITSSDNSKVKHIKKLLTDKRYRAESRAYVAEGARWVLDALTSAAELFDGVFYKESCADRFADLIASAESELGAERVCPVADRIFDKISDTRHGQGILAALRIRKEITAPCGSHGLYLDRIRDPGNLGTIVRTAVAAGFNFIYLDGCADVYDPKVVRSTMGALLKINFITVTDGEAALGRLKPDYKIVAADMSGENIFTNQEKFDKICLIVGSEADGIRPELIGLCDKTFAIPMQNTESLNAAVSAGILMYQLVIDN